MRQIKFRGKTEIGEWAYGFYTQGGFINPNTGEETIRHIIDSDMLYDIDPDTLGQFTGLHDKNGKEIYEGDIVRNNLSDKPFGIVEWNRNGFFFVNPFIENELYTDDCIPLGKALSMIIFEHAEQINVCFEVIGNIHDNPDLLKK